MATTWTPWTVISLFLFLFVMFGLGSSLDWEAFKERIKKPTGIIIGFCSQFLFMPLWCWALSQWFNLDEPLAIAFITLGCCPGGALSNILCYLFQADITLSIAMTTCSSIAAIAMLPLNTFIYIKIASDTDLEYDWVGMILSTIVVIIGTFAGLYVSVHYAEYSWRTERFANICMWILIIGSFVNNALSDASLFRYAGRVYPCVFLPSLTGGIVGLSTSLLFKLPKFSCVAVAIETAVQNKLLALAIITLTFKDKDMRNEAYGIPLLYGMMSFIWNAFVAAILFKLGWSGAPPDMGIIDAFKDYRKKRREAAAAVANLKAGNAPPDASTAPSGEKLSPRSQVPDTDEETVATVELEDINPSQPTVPN